MIEHTLDTTSAILHIHLKSPLGQADFEQLATAVDPFIAKSGTLAGLIIETPTFPDWESLRALTAHFRFVRDHHKLIKRIALVTDSGLGNIAEHLVAQFVSAEIKHFPGAAVDAARHWIIDTPK